MAPLAKLLRSLPPTALVAIDGFAGAGKTHLTERLAFATGFSFIDLDELLLDREPTTGDNYVSLLDQPRLSILLSSRSTSTIMCGICMRDVLQVIAIEADLHVYVKKLATSGVWHDGCHLADSFERQDSSSWLESIEHEYHHRQRPHERADFTYERIAD